MSIPDICLKHLVQFYVTSNEELAVFTNVCRSWRDVVTDVVVLKSHQEQKAVGSNFYALLLPSMIRSLIEKEDYECDTYCVSWFAGFGASATSVDIGTSSGSSNSNHHQTKGKGGGNAPSVNRRRLCVSEWFGYSAPYDVLKYFGYSFAFVQCVIRRCVEVYGLNVDYRSIEIQSDPAKLASESFTKQMYRGNRLDNSELARASFAVRGSTYAFPVRAHKPPRLIRAGTSLDPSSICHRAIQFLDAPGNHAVRMITPPFRRLVEQPVTIFLVGIACEDGCFFSGLQKRFECGHLYADNYRDSSMDYSNICISASDESQKRKSSLNEDGNKQAFLNSDVDQCDSDGDDELMSLPDINEVVRGLSGPGVWHVYTCIFDHNRSVVRVDGQIESSKCNMTDIDESDSYGTYSESGENEESRIKSTYCGESALDGLTIGSDHRFDMSLCDGGGYEGEGEGAIAEIAVFKGRLHDEDIMSIENYLLDKYSIPRGSTQSLIYDEWRRQAHSLIMQPPRWDPQVRQQQPGHDTISPSDGDGNSSCSSDDIDNLPWPSIPLRVAARHRNVAWHKYDPVTGKTLSVSRIGSKSTGSSDW